MTVIFVYHVRPNMSNSVATTTTKEPRRNSTADSKRCCCSFCSTALNSRLPEPPASPRTLRNFRELLDYTERARVEELENKNRAYYHAEKQRRERYFQENREQIMKDADAHERREYKILTWWSMVPLAWLMLILYFGMSGDSDTAYLIGQLGAIPIGCIGLFVVVVWCALCCDRRGKNKLSKQ